MYIVESYDPDCRFGFWAEVGRDKATYVAIPLDEVDQLAKRIVDIVADAIGQFGIKHREAIPEVARLLGVDVRPG